MLRPAPQPSHRMRVAVLWTGVSGYLDAELRAFRDLGDDVYLCSRAASQGSDFDRSMLGWLTNRLEYHERPNSDDLRRDLDAFRPDCVLIGGWQTDAFRQAAVGLRGHAVRVLCMDNQWRATPRQRVGCAISRWYVRPYFDAVLVPGTRQADFARRLGFSPDRIGFGLLAPDHSALDAAARDHPYERRPEAFGYVGRLASEKGISDLADAYGAYRSSAHAPWPLVIAGMGPEMSLVADIAGVRLQGFVQPADLPHMLASISCLVMPSRIEAWGVAIVEACVAGLPVICTSACGVVGDVIDDGSNGIVVPPARPDALAAAMAGFSSWPVAHRARMSEAARVSARSLTPEHLVASAHSLVAHCRGDRCDSHLSPDGSEGPVRGGGR